MASLIVAGGIIVSMLTACIYFYKQARKAGEWKAISENLRKQNKSLLEDNRLLKKQLDVPDADSDAGKLSGEGFTPYKNKFTFVSSSDRT